MLTVCLLIAILVVLIVFLRQIISLLVDINSKMDSVRYFIMDYEKKHKSDK